MKSINSKILGELAQYEQFEDWWISAPFNFPFIDQELPVTFMGVNPDMDENFISEADEALSNFMKLDSLYRFKISQYIFENFVEYASYVGEEDIPAKMKGVQPLNIWNFVYPSQIYVNRRPYNDKDIYIVVACECEWEVEHGLQLVFRQGKKLTRVSDQDGHLTEADAYDKPDSEDKLLSQF